MTNTEVALDRAGPDGNEYKFGRNAHINAAGNEDIIEQGGLMQYEPGGAEYDLVSSDAADVGIVWVEGVDANYVWTREYAELTGTTPVSLTTKFYSIFCAKACFISTGQITVRKISDASTRAIIPVGLGGTLMAACTIPVGYRVALCSWEARARKATGKTGVPFYCQLLFRTPPNGPWTIQDILETDGAHEFIPPIAFDGPADIKVHVAECGVNNVRFEGNFGYAVRKINYPLDLCFGPCMVNPLCPE